jgi:hypothetical protein
MDHELPAHVHAMLKKASEDAASAPRRAFTCKVFGPEWNSFVEAWAPRIHAFVEQALGEYGTEPRSEILPLPPGMHVAGATASFDMLSGQTRICKSVEGKPGQTLEKLTHEFTHGSLSKFPEGDPFYEEGFVDYTTWLIAHAPYWGEFRDDMIKSAAYNIAHRRDRALHDMSDYERKRWAGGLFASLARGPYILSGLRMKKGDGNFTW